MTTQTRRNGWLLWCLAVAPLAWPAAAEAQSDTVVYYYTDAVGTVRMTTDENGTVLARYDDPPFGAPSPAPPPPVEPRRFAGKERDGETGLDYFGARHYSNQTGRFTTVDPLLDMQGALGNPQLWNRYTYALNNPLKFTDPDGRNPLAVGGAIGAGVYAAWNAYQNVQQGRRWYENVGVEASKGFLVGATLGLAAPALATLLVPNAGIAVAGSGAIERALRSADSAIRFEGETARFLEERSLLKAFDVNIGGRQIDAIAGTTRNFVVEMTTGQGGGKLAQAAVQAKATGLDVIIYGRNLTQGFVREALRQGYRVARSPEELERLLRE